MGEKKPRFTIFRKISPFSLAKCFSLCYNIDTERQKGAFRPSPCGVLCPAHDFIGIIPQRATSAHPFFCPRPPPPRTGTLFVPSRFPAKKNAFIATLPPPFPVFLSPPSRSARHLPFPKGEARRGRPSPACLPFIKKQIGHPTNRFNSVHFSFSPIDKRQKVCYIVNGNYTFTRKLTDKGENL